MQLLQLVTTETIHTYILETQQKKFDNVVAAKILVHHDSIKSDSALVKCIG